MKCPFCGKEYSKKVCMIHMRSCKKIEKELKDYTVKELKEMCKEKGIKGYSKLNEKNLIALIEGDK